MAFSKGALTDEFRKRRRGLILGGSFPIQQEYKHPLSGARLIIAKIDKKPRPVEGPYIVGWAADDSEALWHYQNFETQQKAMAAFTKAQAKGPPTHGCFQDDPQYNDVMGWEAEFRDQTPELTIDQMSDVVTRLADIFNMAAPYIIYTPNPKNKVYGEAVLEDNVILMRRAHLAILLHEFAHLVNHQVNKDDWAWHGPGFMRTYLSVLSLFPKLAGDIEPHETAFQKKLSIANENDVPASHQLKNWVASHHAGKAPSFMPSST